MAHFKVNGLDRSFDGDPEMPLLWYLRDILGLTGTKFGCGMALCGACTVLQNGKAIRSCTKQMGTVTGVEITTIEAISHDGDHPVQMAWAEVNVPECGYCQPGQIMQAVFSRACFQPEPSSCALASFRSRYGPKFPQQPGQSMLPHFIPEFSLASTPTAPYTSLRTARRWETACAPAFREYSPTNSMPTGAA